MKVFIQFVNTKVNSLITTPRVFIQNLEIQMGKLAQATIQKPQGTFSSDT